MDPLTLYPVHEEVLKEVSADLPSACWDLLWKSGRIRLRTYDSDLETGGGYLARLIRVARVDPVAAEMAGWLLCSRNYQFHALYISLVDRRLWGLYPVPEHTWNFEAVRQVLSLAGILKHSRLEYFLSKNRLREMDEIDACW